jgi:hypothetical protein
MMRENMCVVTVAVCVICLFMQMQHVSGVTRKTVYITQNENGATYTLNKGNDTKWLAKGYYAALNNDTGWVRSLSRGFSMLLPTGPWPNDERRTFQKCSVSQTVGHEHMGGRSAIMHWKLYPPTQFWEVGRSFSFNIVVSENISVTGETVHRIPSSLYKNILL